MEVFDCIKTRRSVRNYSEQKIDEGIINRLIQAAIYAPSGKNGQPWRFKIITDRISINRISDLSAYSKWMRTAQCFIFIYLDKTKSYDYTKDMQSCGAAIQNILLCANSNGLGSCWIGEILNKFNEVDSFLNIESKKYELAAMLTIGYQLGRTINVKRNNINKFLL